MAQTVLTLADWYGVAGIVVAAAFLLVGLDRIDPAARNAYAVRPLLIPGVVLLWPLVLFLWVRRERQKRADNTGAVQ